jgi:hypothetical protein
MSEDKVYEVKKDLTLSSNMQLVDLNGTRPNFQSDVVCRAANPAHKFRACIVSQEQLDCGDVKFENSENGKYARRVTFQEDRHVNHYLAVRSEGGDTDIQCHVVVRLRELPSPPSQSSQPSQSVTPPSSPQNSPQLAPELKLTDRELLEAKLRELKYDPNYQDLPPGIAEQDDIILPDLPPAPKKQKWNIWVIIGVVCIGLALFLWWRSSSGSPVSVSDSQIACESK